MVLFVISSTHWGSSSICPEDKGGYCTVVIALCLSLSCWAGLSSKAKGLHPDAALSIELSVVNHAPYIHFLHEKCRFYDLHRACNHKPLFWRPNFYLIGIYFSHSGFLEFFPTFASQAHSTNWIYFIFSWKFAESLQGNRDWSSQLKASRKLLRIVTLIYPISVMPRAALSSEWPLIQTFWVNCCANLLDFRLTNTKCIMSKHCL